jgi:hypothetical protein
VQGAIKLQYTDNTTVYIILEIQEFRNSGPVFTVYDPDQRGTHLLSAADVRTNWNAWIGELVNIDRIVNVPPSGLEIY